MHICGNIHGFMWESMTQNNCNTYLINGPARILIDPGHLELFDHVRYGLMSLDLKPEDMDLVICTHAHPDHLEAVQLFYDLPAKIAYHEADWNFAKQMLSYFGDALKAPLETIRPDFFLEEGAFEFNGIRLQVYHTPGHAPGAVCVYEPLEKTLFCGDLVFREGVGRTDLPGGDGEQLKNSIRRMAALDTVHVLTGHGDILSGTEAVKVNFDDIFDFWFAHI